MIWFLMLLVGAIVFGLAYLIDAQAEARSADRRAALRALGSEAAQAYADARARGVDPEIAYACAKAHARPVGHGPSASARAAFLSCVDVGDDDEDDDEEDDFDLDDDDGWLDWAGQTGYEDAFADDRRSRDHDHHASRSSSVDDAAFAFWFDDDASLAAVPDFGNNTHAFDHHDSDGGSWINPATGLSMISDGPHGLDVGGNAYGLSNDEHFYRGDIGGTGSHWD